MFTEDQLFTMAGAALYNRIIAQFTETGMSPEDIALRMAENDFPEVTAESAPQLFGDLAREYYGEELPQAWTDLSREQAVLIQSGQTPFEGWEVPKSPPPPGPGDLAWWGAAAGGAAKGAQLDHVASGLYKGWRGVSWPYRKHRDWKQARADALTRDVLTRVRAGPAYTRGYEAEVDRIAAQPRNEREILDTQATKLDVAGLQVNPHGYWDEWAGRGGSQTWPLNQKYSTRLGKGADQEHARRLGEAEARHQIARTSSIGLGSIQDATTRVQSGERTQEQYEKRVRDLLGTPTLPAEEEGQ